MRRSPPSVTFVYRGSGRDIPWENLIHEIADHADSGGALALVINCTVAAGADAPESQETVMLQRSEKPLTIEDVARLAGVSRMTVSRVMNNREGVNPQIHARVRAVVDAVGYTLNETARALVLRRSA